jgi:hypothetical protein
MVAVVTRGTARRAFGALHAADGSPLPIGAKTGTGNNYGFTSALPVQMLRMLGPTLEKLMALRGG